MKKDIIICILVILLLGLGGYLVYDKLIDKKEGTNTVVENNTETEQSSKNNELVVKQLLEGVSIGYCGGGYRYEINKGDVLKYDTLSDNERFSLAYKSWIDTHGDITLNKSTMLSAYNNFFGDGEYTLPEKVTIIGKFGPPLKLSGEEYVRDGEGGGGCADTIKYVLDAFNVSDSKITFDVVPVVIEYDTVIEEPKNAYIMELGSVNYDRTQANEIYERRIEVSAKDLTDEKILDAIASTKSNFPQFRFTFNAQNDRYIFESVERIN